MDGWIKLHRKIYHSDIFTHEGMLKLFILCLLKATHKKTTVRISGILKTIELNPGQFVSGRHSLWEDYHQIRLKKSKPRKKPIPTDRTLFRWLITLKNMQVLSIKSYNKYSIITVLNWNQYQQDVHQVSNRIEEKCAKLSIKKVNKKSLISDSCNDGNVRVDHQHSKKSARFVHKQEGSINTKPVFACDFFEVAQKQDVAYQDAFPGLDRDAEYKKMVAWLESNPTKRPKKQYGRFINSWLSRACEKKKDAFADWRSELKPI